MILDREINAYIEQQVVEPFDEMASIRARKSREGKLWHVSPAQGRFLDCLTRSAGNRIVEVGTFFGYSTIWLANAAGDSGHVVTIEKEREYAESARQSIEACGLASRVEIVVGDAVEELSRLPNDSADLVFIDGPKVHYPEFLKLALRCCRVGGYIVADNALHRGRVVHDPTATPQTRAIVEYNEAAMSSDSLSSIIVPLGDGLTLSYVLGKS